MRALRRMPLVGFLLLAAGRSWAQEVPPEYELPVDEWVLAAEKKESPFYFGRFEDRYKDDLGRGRVGAVLDHMVALFDGLDWGDEEPQQAKILNQVRPFLAAVKGAIHAATSDGLLDTVEEQDAFLEELEERFDIGTTDLVLDPARGYFVGTDDALPLANLEGDKPVLLLRAEHVRQWRLLEDSITTTVKRLHELVASANVASLDKAVTRWENVLERGYSQMPWESLANGYLIPPRRLGADSDRLGPPDHQWVLLHPSLGIEIDPSPFDESRVKESLQVELLGHVWYRGEDLAQYFGVSAALSLREDLDPGIGLLLHLRRNWSLGITWHGVEQDPFVFLSLDLFSFARTSSRAYQAAFERIREL